MSKIKATITGEISDDPAIKFVKERNTAIGKDAIRIPPRSGRINPRIILIFLICV